MASISYSRCSKNSLNGFSRSLKALRSSARSVIRSRGFANGDVPPLNEPLPNLPAPPPNVVHGHVTKDSCPGTQITTLENGIKVASEESFGQFSTVGG